MRAFTIAKYRAPLVLSEISEPTVGPNDVLIDVKAAALNQLDAKIQSGEFKALLKFKMPLVLGCDVAGVVSAVGANVTKFSVGDEVFAMPRISRIGTFAEKISIDQADVSLKPSNLSMVEAASLPLVSLTAWQAMSEIGNLGSGKKVLIHGGAGGVGAISIQIAKHLGAFVATTASAKNAAVVRALGADQVVDYKSEKFDELVSDCDVVLDSLGGYNLLRSIATLKQGGIAIGIAGPPDPAYAESNNAPAVIKLVIKLLSSKVRKAAKSRSTSYKFLFVTANGSQLERIAHLVEQGIIRTSVGATYSFDQTATALTDLSQGTVPQGKVVIDFEKN